MMTKQKRLIEICLLFCYNYYCDGDNMDYLYNLDLNENEILDIVDANSEVKDLSEEDIIKYIYILIDVGCTQKQIHNIVTSNPFYFSRDINDVGKFLRRLNSLNVSDLADVLDSNPWLLNKDSFELDEFLMKERNTDSLDEILERFLTSFN